MKELSDLTYKKLLVSALQVDESYQRLVDSRKVQQIIKEFEWDAFGAILVSVRVIDGIETYWVIDGQHRLVASIQLSIVEVPCCLVYNLTKEQEANLFLKLNTIRAQARAFDRLKAKIIAGNKDTLNMIDILNEYGLKPNLINGGSSVYRKKGYINNIGCLENVYSKGEAHFRAVISLLTDIWKNYDGSFDADSLKSDTILGFSMFIQKTNKVFDDDLRDRFIKKIRRLTALQMIQESKRNMAIYRGSNHINYYRALVEHYNYNSKYKIEFQG